MNLTKEQKIRLSGQKVPLGGMWIPLGFKKENPEGIMFEEGEKFPLYNGKIVAWKLFYD